MSRKELRAEQLERLAKLAELPDDQIDTVDIPEAPAENWIHARRGDRFMQVNQPVTLPLDADVVTRFKEHTDGGSYQTEINRVLRKYIADCAEKCPA